MQLSNCIFTMNSWTDKKIILRCFITTGLFCLHEKFQVYQSSYSRFLRKNAIFLSYLWGKYFSCKMFTVLHQSKKELSDSGQNWAKTWHLLFKTWKSSISIDSAIVQCRHQIPPLWLHSGEGSPSSIISSLLCFLNKEGCKNKNASLKVQKPSSKWPTQ